MALKIQRIDARRDDARSAIMALRAKLAPSGNIVSEAGRRKTAEVFGRELTPAEVVEKICADVRSQGLKGLLHYSAKLDGASLTAETLRVPAEDLAAAHKSAPAEFLKTIGRIRDNILRFQKAILHRDVEVDMPIVVGGGADPPQNAGPT
jgi:histidinol dehydrogenase